MHFSAIPVFWKASSCSLVSSLIEAVMALNAPFSLFPNTMWSGSALRRIPYLSLSVDSVNCRTLSSCRMKNRKVLFRWTLSFHVMQLPLHAQKMGNENLPDSTLPDY